MTSLSEFGKAVHDRRTRMGLTQSALAKLSDLSRQTIVGLESGAIKDLSLQRADKIAGVLGLALHVALAPRKKAKMSPLSRAARTASVSYRETISTVRLKRVLLSGKFDMDDAPYVHALLDEAPVSLLASLAEQLQPYSDSQPVWTQFRKLAHDLRSKRDLWQ